MKHIGQVAVLAALFSLPLAVLAQDAKPGAAKPAPAQPAAAPTPAAKPAAAAVQPAAKPEAPAPAVKMAAGTPRRSRAHEDARKCLELPTNMEIHKCAEPYR